MRVQFVKKFSKDLDKIPRPKDKKAILKAIQAVKQSSSIDQVPGVKKLIGFDNAYRICAGDFRIGVFVDGNLVTLTV